MSQETQAKTQAETGAPYPEAVQKRLDAHLDAVEDVLRRGGSGGGGGMGRIERATIVDELANQIADMLAARCGDREVGVSDLEAVLSELDPPASYGDGEATGKATGEAAGELTGEAVGEAVGGERASENGGGDEGSVEPGWHRLSVIAFVWALSILVLPALPVMAQIGGAEGSVVRMLLVVVVVVGVTGIVGSVVLGFVAIAELKRQPADRRKLGMGLAVFAAIFSPALVMVGIGISLVSLGFFVALPPRAVPIGAGGQAMYSGVVVALVWGSIVFLPCVVAWLYGRWVYRYAYDLPRLKPLVAPGAWSWIFLVVAMVPGIVLVNSGSMRAALICGVLLIAGAICGFAFRRSGYGLVCAILCTLGLVFIVLALA